MYMCALSSFSFSLVVLTFNVCMYRLWFTAHMHFQLRRRWAVLGEGRGGVGGRGVGTVQFGSSECQPAWPSTVRAMLLSFLLRVRILTWWLWNQPILSLLLFVRVCVSSVQRCNPTAVAAWWWCVAEERCRKDSCRGSAHKEWGTYVHTCVYWK